MSSHITRIFQFLPFFLLSVITHLTFATGSELPVSWDAQCVLNTKTNTFMVFDNSKFYLTARHNDSIWEKHVYKYLPEDLLFSDFNRLYRGLSTENGKILFIHRGVGEVYELRNDSVVRIDQSFNHKNQYGAAVFPYKNRVYAIGGYGLFTTKNLFIFFSESKEWTLMPSDVIMEARLGHDYQITDDCVYIFGGYFKKEGDVPLKRNDCWKFDFTTESWTKLGQLNLFFEKYSRATSITSPLELYFDAPYIYRLNCAENKVEKYMNADILHISKGYFDTSKNFILLDHIIGDKRFLSLHNSNSILQKKISETNFYTESWLTTNKKIGALILAVLGLLVVVLFRQNLKSSILRRNNGKNKIVKINNDFYIKDIAVRDYFNGKDLELFLCFLRNKEEYLDLNTLDDIFISDVNVTTIALKKRREQSYKLIKDRLSIILDMPIGEIFIESLDDSDKRIKKIKLNAKLF
jgi:hypothetical protein